MEITWHGKPGAMAHGSNSVHEIKIVYDYEGEWTTLYIAGVKVAENHKLSAKEVLRELHRAGIISKPLYETIPPE